MIIIIPDELREEFSTFLEVGLASVTAYPDEELTPNELRLIKIIQSYELVLSTGNLTMSGTE